MKTNDFSVRIATVNGTGSMSANTIIYKTLFRMGIGASPKNLFPSNIKGLPTWFQIRVSPQGYQAMKESSEVAVWMNPNTLDKDIASAPENGVVVYNSDAMDETLIKGRPDLTLYPIPVTSLTKESVPKPKLRPLLANMIYVGAIAELFNLDTNTLEAVVKDIFKAKESVVELNLNIIQTGANYVKEHIKKTDPYQFELLTPPKNKITIEGNDASGLGAAFGGCTFLAWYPITPSSSVAEAVEKQLKTHHNTPDGKAKYAIVQAEDELAAAGMTLGAGWAGARAMTCTSGPGISLMTEFIGYGYFAEIPGVFVNVQRVGPSTGLPTRTQQGDLLFVSTLGHGDTNHVMLFPATPIECFELMQEAFNYAERFQTPIFVMTDLDIGMNYWISDDLPYPQKGFDRGKVLSKEDIEKNGNSFARYEDIDGDGIPYRTLPNTQADGAAYFTRGSGHTETAAYSESSVIYDRVTKRLVKKFKTIEQNIAKPIISGDPKAVIGILGVGSSHFAVEEAADQLAAEGVQTKLCRPLAFPFGEEIEQFLFDCDHVFVIDQNRDGQLLQLIRNRFPQAWDRLISITYNLGLPLPANAITRQILKDLKRDPSAYEFEQFKPEPKETTTYE